MAVEVLDFFNFQVTKQSQIESFCGSTVDSGIQIVACPGTPPFPGCDYVVKIQPGTGFFTNTNDLYSHQAWSTVSGTWYGFDGWVYFGTSSNLRQGAKFFDWGEGYLYLGQGSTSGNAELRIHDANGAEVGVYDTAPSDDPFAFETWTRVKVLYKSHGTTGQCKVWKRNAGDTSWTLVCASDANQDFNDGSGKLHILGQNGSTANQPFYSITFHWAGGYLLGGMTDENDFWYDFDTIRHSIHFDSAGAGHCDDSGTNPGATPSAGNWKNIGAEDAAGDKDTASSVSVQGGPTTDKSGGCRTNVVNPNVATSGLGDSANEDGNDGHALIGSDYTAKGGAWSFRTSIAKTPGASDGYFWGLADNNASDASATYTILGSATPGGGNRNSTQKHFASFPTALEHAVGGIIGSSGSYTTALSAFIYQGLYEIAAPSTKLVGPPNYKSGKVAKAA